MSSICFSSLFLNPLGQCQEYAKQSPSPGQQPHLSTNTRCRATFFNILYSFNVVFLQSPDGFVGRGFTKRKLLLIDVRSNILFLPFRRTHPVSLSASIRQYISTKYDQHPDMFTRDMEAIDKLRVDAVNSLEAHTSGIRKLTAYAAQLVWIGGKFPIDVSKVQRANDPCRS